MSLSDRVRRLEDRLELSELVAKYGIAVDDRDVDGIAELYTRDGVFAGNRFGTSTGNAAIREYFGKRWANSGWSFHFTHTQVVDFLGDDHAVGCVTGHTEQVQDGDLIVAANRYHDHYVREDGRWRFRLRSNRLLYLMSIAELPQFFADERRKRWPGQPPELVELRESADAYRQFREEVAARYAR
jgi:uncharacterized protein (TIGR02246 family)